MKSTMLIAPSPNRVFATTVFEVTRVPGALKRTEQPSLYRISMRHLIIALTYSSIRGVDDKITSNQPI